MAKGQRRFSIRDDALQESLGALIQAGADRDVEPKFESLPIESIKTCQKNPRYVGRITPEEFERHVNGEIDLSQEQDPDRKRFFDGIVELAGTISDQGLIHPVAVREEGDDYIILAGERRFLAHILLKKKFVQSVIRLPLEPSKETALRIIENISRSDLVFREMIDSIRELNRVHQEEFGQSLTGPILSGYIRKTESTCRRYIQVMEAPDDVQSLIQSGQITGLRAALEVIQVRDAQKRGEVVADLSAEKPESRTVLSPSPTESEAPDSTQAKPHQGTSDGAEKTERSSPPAVSGASRPTMTASAIRAKARGASVNLGSIKNTKLVKYIIESTMGESSFNEAFSNINWDDHASVQTAWTMYINLLELKF